MQVAGADQQRGWSCIWALVNCDTAAAEGVSSGHGLVLMASKGSEGRMATVAACTEWGRFPWPVPAHSSALPSPLSGA